MISKNLRVARRYAKALLSLAQENDIMERANEDMKLVNAVFGMDKELKIILKSPIVREGKKQKILSRLFEDKVHPLIMHYMLIIARKRRAALLDGISQEFQLVYKNFLGIEPVQVITAAPLEDALREKVIAVARRMTTKTIEFREEVNPSIIGGFILNLGDKQYDASVRRKLANLKHQFNVT